MKKIIIALDYDPSARVVAETGDSISRDAGDEVVLLHIIDNRNCYTRHDFEVMGFAGFPAPGTEEAAQTENIEKGATEFLKATRHHLGKDKMKILVRKGPAGATILGAADELKSDLIIMGSHSQRRNDKIFLGSITEHVLQHSLVPVLIIPTRNCH